MASIGVDWAARKRKSERSCPMMPNPPDMQHDAPLPSRSSTRAQLHRHPASCDLWLRGKMLRAIFSVIIQIQILSLFAENASKIAPKHRYHAIAWTSWCILSQLCQVYPGNCAASRAKWQREKGKRNNQKKGNNQCIFLKALCSYSNCLPALLAACACSWCLPALASALLQTGTHRQSEVTMGTTGVCVWF